MRVDPTLTMQTKVISRDDVVFEGPVAAVSSVNQSGPFDVFPGHANFICLIQNYVRLHITNEQSRTVDLNNGVLRVEDNEIEVYIGVKMPETTR